MYVLIDIGCLECGEESQLIGVYHHRDAALEELNEQAKEHNVTLRADQRAFDYFAGGQHEVRLFSTIDEA